MLENIFGNIPYQAFSDLKKKAQN